MKEERVKQVAEGQEEQNPVPGKTAPNGMPVYDKDEPWIQQYVEDFGNEPSFF